MKKILIVLAILLIFFIAITIFIAIDSSIMINHYFNEINTEVEHSRGLGVAFLPVISTWKFTFLMIIVAIIVKLNKKISSLIKVTIYFLPVLSFYSFFYATIPALKLMNLLNLLK